MVKSMGDVATLKSAVEAQLSLAGGASAKGSSKGGKSKKKRSGGGSSRSATPTAESDGSVVCIAHTRWATHGEPSARNAHPHGGPSRDFFVVHNGIFTNYAEAKTALATHGATFESDTDTEVFAVTLAHLFKVHQEAGSEPSLRQLVAAALTLLDGAYAVCVVSPHFPGELVAARRGSPLAIGIVSRGQAAGADGATAGAEPVATTIPVHYTPVRKPAIFRSSTGDNSLASRLSHALDFEERAAANASGILAEGQVVDEAAGATSAGVEFVLASDTGAIAEWTDRALYLEDGDMVHFSPETSSFRVYRGAAAQATDATSHRTIDTLDLEATRAIKGSYDHFMLKEIHEQPSSIFNSLRGRIDFTTRRVLLGGLTDHIDTMRRCRRLIFIACGTSYHSALACRQLLETLSRLPVDVQLASDFLDRETPIFRDDSCFFVSQSGETADTLQALAYCRARGALCIGIVNVPGSAIARNTDAGVYIRAGTEIGVASTKAFTSQVIAIVLIALFIGQDRVSAQQLCHDIVDSLAELPKLVTETLSRSSEYEEYARTDVSKFSSMLLVGRGFQFATCMEGALKIKEIAYIHTEAVLSGELKHGPLALVDPNLPLLYVMSSGAVFARAQLGLQQILARGGRPTVLLTEDSALDTSTLTGVGRFIRVPATHEALQVILNVIPLQLVSYYAALELGKNVDRPRNLAKSVSVV
jgi:glucosamine--fructose-6-phosphate aminotransferase (isomerizing)